MKNYFITALLGLLVACDQNSTPDVINKANRSSGNITTISDSEVISVTRMGNPNGRTLILIPGLASSADVWDSTVEALQNYDLHIVQVAGFAGHPKVITKGSFTDAIAMAIHTYIEKTQNQDVVVIGHSLGGFVALKAAMLDMSKIDELIIVDSLPFLAQMFLPGTTPQQAAQSAPLMAQQMANMPRAAFDQQQQAGLARLTKTEAYRETLANWGKASDQTVIASTLGELLAADLRNDLSNLNIDITVLAAYDAAMGVPQTVIKDMYKAQYMKAPNHNIIMIKDSFHFIMIDQSTAFFEAVKKTLED